MHIDAFKVRLLGVCLTCVATVVAANDDLLDVLSDADTPAPAANEAEEAAPAAAEAEAPVAEEEAPAADAVEGEEAEAAPAAEGEKAEAKSEEEEEENPFSVLPFARVVRASGTVTVLNPDVNQAQSPIIGKMYPLGTVFETGANSSLLIALGDYITFTLDSGTVASVKAGADPVKSRVVAVVGGTVSTTFDEKLPKGMVAIESACVRLRDVCGRINIEVKNGGDGCETFDAAVVTGSALVEGAQYKIPVLGAADKITVFTAGNRSLSRIEGVTGKFDLVLSKGSEAPLVYHVTPQATAKIFREHAKIGGRLLVSVLVANPYGEAVHRFAFAEGRPEVATGELIKKVNEGENLDGAPEGADQLPKAVAAPAQPAAEEPAVEAESPQEEPAADDGEAAEEGDGEDLDADAGDDDLDFE